MVWSCRLIRVVPCHDLHRWSPEAVTALQLGYFIPFIHPNLFPWFLTWYAVFIYCDQLIILNWICNNCYYEHYNSTEEYPHSDKTEQCRWHYGHNDIKDYMCACCQRCLFKDHVNIPPLSSGRFRSFLVFRLPNPEFSVNVPQRGRAGNFSAIQHDSGRDFKYIFVKMLYLQSRIYML